MTQTRVYFLHRPLHSSRGRYLAKENGFRLWGFFSRCRYTRLHQTPHYWLKLFIISNFNTLMTVRFKWKLTVILEQNYQMWRMDTAKIFKCKITGTTFYCVSQCLKDENRSSWEQSGEDFLSREHWLFKNTKNINKTDPESILEETMRSNTTVSKWQSNRFSTHSSCATWSCDFSNKRRSN